MNFSELISPSTGPVDTTNVSLYEALKSVIEWTGQVDYSNRSVFMGVIRVRVCLLVRAWRACVKEITHNGEAADKTCVCCSSVRILHFWNNRYCFVDSKGRARKGMKTHMVVLGRLLFC